MMYYLHLLSDDIKGFNVFSYVTFRAVAAAVTAFVLSLAFGNLVIRKLIAPQHRVRIGAVGCEPAACEREVALSAVASSGLRPSRAFSFGCDLQSSRSG